MKPLIYAIDDDQTSRVLYRITFRDDYRIRTFEDGIGLLQAIDEERPDIIICDLCLPWWDGYSVLEAVTAYDPTIPIIVATGMDGDEQKIAVEALGYAYYHKACNINKLRELVQCHHCQKLI